MLAHVLLRLLRRRVSSWIQRPLGQLAGFVLLVAVASAGMPTGKLHAHAGGDHGHHHSTQLADVTPDHGDPAPEPSSPLGTVLHGHDVGPTVTALPAFPVVILSAGPPTAPARVEGVSPPPSAPRTPPHRPPIA